MAPSRFREEAHRASVRFVPKSDDHTRASLVRGARGPLGKVTPSTPARV